MMAIQVGIAPDSWGVWFPKHEKQPSWDRCLDEMAEVFSVKQFSSFSSSKFPIVIVGKSPLSAGLVRKQVPLLHPAA